MNTSRRYLQTVYLNPKGPMVFVRHYCSMWFGYLRVACHVLYFHQYVEKAVTRSGTSQTSFSEIRGLDRITFAVATFWMLQ